MPLQILMPVLPPAMGSGTLTRWLVSEGDPVTPGMVIAEIETATATMEVEAVVGGTISRILAAAGTTNIRSQSPIAELRLSGETDGDRAAARRHDDAAVHTGGADGPIRVAVSPLARRLAREKEIDLSAVRGSGPNGRIVKRDVDAAAVARDKREAAAVVIAPRNDERPSVATMASAQAVQLQPARTFDLVNFEDARHALVSRLTRAASEVPHAYLAIDCHLDEMLRTRERMNEMSPPRGSSVYRLTINDFVVKAWALALQRVPASNVTFRDGTVIQHQDADVSVAMAVAGGVRIVPIRRAHTKSLSEISNEIRFHRTVPGHEYLGTDDAVGSATTISNLGMFGIKSFSSVVQAPQSTLLAVGAAERRPVVAGNRIEIGTVMPCTLSCDQRAIDAAVGADLLAAFRAFIEDPVRMLV